MKKKKLHLFIVDPQVDFCVDTTASGWRGRLVVPGAHDDMLRVAGLIDRLGDRLDDVDVSMDSHQKIGIERPRWWRRVSDGAEPAPFTCLGVHPDGRRVVKYVPAPAGSPDANAFGMSPTEEEYTTYIPSYFDRGGPTGEGSIGYLRALAARGRYPHMVWTEHCVVGTEGWSIVPEVADALGRWEREQFARINYVVKGNNPWTEHFSGVCAEVVDPSDPATQVNTGLVRALEDADLIAVTGEALSHCVANTFRDVVANFGAADSIRKLVLLTDCCSNVGGFDFMGDAFVKEMVAKGMQTATSVDFLA